jgi:membrane protease YdiL (CAAX protease family)
MYIAQAFKNLHEGWRYLVGGILIFLISQLGSIPFVVAVLLKIMSEGGTFADLEDSSILMNTLDSNLTFFLLLLGYAIGLLGLYLIARFLHKQSFTSLTTARKKIDWKRFWFGFGLIGITTVVLTSLDYFGNTEDYILQFELVPFIILAIIAIVMVPLQTSFEEYFFRGYLLQGIGVSAGNRWLPLLITSLVFGGLHVFNPEVEKLGYIIMIYYIGTGLFLGIITLMDDGLELALGFHAGNNLVAALLVTADWTVFQTNSILKDISEPSAGFDVIIPVLIVYPIFLGIMAWRYKWTGWKDKLFGKVKPPPKDETEIADILN